MPIKGNMLTVSAGGEKPSVGTHVMTLESIEYREFPSFDDPAVKEPKICFDFKAGSERITKIANPIISPKSTLTLFAKTIHPKLEPSHFASTDALAEQLNKLEGRNFEVVVVPGQKEGSVKVAAASLTKKPVVETAGGELVREGNPLEDGPTTVDDIPF